MRRSPVAVAALAASLLVAACVGDRETTIPSGPASRLIAAPTAPTCSFPTMTKDAQAFFSDKKDSVYVIINDMQTAYKTSPSAATPRGLDVLREVAAARFTSRQITGSDGGPLVVDVFSCTDLASLDLSSAQQSLQAGVFEVRGDNPSAPAALNPSTNTPRWGVEPRFSAGWPSATVGNSPAPNGRYLVFGYPLSAALSITLGFEKSDGFTGFEVGTRSSLGADVVKSQLRVGACIPAGEGTNANRLIHANLIIPNESPNFCATVGAAADKKSTTWLASFEHSLTSLIMPKPLYATTTLLSFDFTGGGMGGWSPMGFGAIPASNVVLGIDQQPANSVASNGGTNDSIVVKATINTSNGTKPVPDVAISLTIAGNNGVPANAILYPQPPHGVTGADGTVKIYFSAGKAGGYTITANGTLEGGTTQSVTSNLFNIKNP